MCNPRIEHFLLFTESLTEEQAKELADWISVILGKQKVSVVKVWKIKYPRLIEFQVRFIDYRW